jgi:hypothetical protein
MSLLSDLASGGVSGLLSGIGSLAKDIRVAITGVDPVKAAEIEAKLAELEQAAMQGQMAINLEEAKSDSIFVAGWRPFVGWICGTGIAIQYVILPLLYAFNLAAPIALDFSELLTLLLGLLGMSTLRTYDKKVKLTAGN